MVLADAGMTGAAVLAGVLAWAGSAKLQRREATAAGFALLGLPRHELLARVVPVVELLVGVALLALPPLGAGLALVLLAVFTWLIVRQVRAGSVVPCACFGQPHAPPLSWAEVARNGTLALLGLLALFAGTAHVPGPRGVLIGAGIVLLGLGLQSHLRSGNVEPGT